jgi:hypothetical protein
MKCSVCRNRPKRKANISFKNPGNNPEKKSHRPSTANDPEQHNDDSNHQKNVDETSHGKGGNQPQEP